MTCERCYQPLDIGAHGIGQCPMQPRRSHGIAPDDIPGGMWVENGFKDPIKVYSHSEHERKLAENGCEIRAKWAGPGDKHLKRWDVPSEKTLRDAAILLSRGGKAQKDDVPPAPEALVRELRDRLYH